MKMHRLSCSLIAVISLTICSGATPCIASDKPLSLNVKNGERGDAPVIAPYMKSLRQAIERNWRAYGQPCDSEAIIFFMVSGNGELRNLAVNQSSGNVAFDESAKTSILQTSPFAVPPKFGQEVLLVYATFNGKLLPKPSMPGARFGQPAQSAYPAPTSAPVGQSFNNSPNFYGANAQPNQQSPYRQGYSQQGFASVADMNQPPDLSRQSPEQAKTREVWTGQQASDSQGSEMGASATSLSLADGPSTFKLIPSTKLQYCTDDQIIQYLKNLHEWLKLPAEELLR